MSSPPVRSGPHNLDAEQLSDGHVDATSFGRPPDLPLEHAHQRDLAFERLGDVVAIHADDPLARPKGGKAIGSEAVEADEQASRPGCLLVELAVKDVEISSRRQRGLP